MDPIVKSSAILEMVTVDTHINVPIHPSIDIDTLTIDDDNPKFVNVEVVRSNVISGNNRRYADQAVRQVNNMVPGKFGYLGHADPSQYGFGFREPQSIFVGSMIDEMDGHTIRCIAKVYIFKSSKLREWIPKSIAAGNPLTVSIEGTGDAIRSGDALEILNMTELDSIDWANPGTEGLDTSKAMSVVREQTDKNNINNGGIIMEPTVVSTKDIIKNVTVTELKAYNPDAYTGIVRSVTVAELRAANPQVVREIEESATVHDISLKIGNDTKSVKLTEMQGMFDDLYGKIAGFEAEQAKSKLNDFKAAKIEELIPVELREQISKRVSGDTEAKIVESINTEIAYVREMRGMGTNEPLGQNKRFDGNGGGATPQEIARGIFGLPAPETK